MKFKNLLLLICLSLIILNNPVKAGSSKSYFDGEIKPKYDFMVGDHPISEDFNIDGTLVYNNTSYESSKLKINWIGGDIKKGTNNYNIIIRLKDNSSIAILSKVTVEATDFNSSLKSSIDGDEIVIDKIYTQSEDGLDKIRYTDNLNIQVKNTVGKVIDGKLKISQEWYSPRIGRSEVKYRFIPNDKRYKAHYGSFSVDFKVPPKIVTTDSGIRISLSNRDNRYIFKVNGKVYKKNIIGKLKSNTKYELEIIQNTASINTKSTLTSSTKGKSLYTTTVTTKPVTTEE